MILSGNKPEWLPSVAKFGWTGVDLFFVLSGYLISSQLFIKINRKEKIIFRQFFLRRAFRILPAFFVTLAIYFWIPFFRERESLPPAWKFLTFTQNFGLNLRYYGTFSHAWSLCVEEHFYLFLPLILIAVQTWKGFSKAYWILIGFCLFGFIIRYYSYDQLYLTGSEEPGAAIRWYQYIYYPTYNRLDGLLAGVSIAGIYHFLPNTWRLISKYSSLTLLAGLITLWGASILCSNQMSFNASVYGYPVVALGYGLLVISAISPASYIYRWNSKAIGLIANLSYALYLTHKGIIHITRELLSVYHINESLLFIISMVTCLCAAYLLHALVEKPFMNLRDRLLGR